MKNQAPVWRLKVELLGVMPTVWRRFDTYADVKLSQLHYFIQGAMGWELMRLFSYQDGRGYGCQTSSELRLCDACRVDDALSYTYDFGDNWQHLITVEKAMAKPTGTYPRVVAGKCACPPEDCGGRGVMRTCSGRSLAAAMPAGANSSSGWAEPFDPKAFDMDETRERLAEYVEVSMPKTPPVV